MPVAGAGFDDARIETFDGVGAKQFGALDFGGDGALRLVAGKVKTQIDEVGEGVVERRIEDWGSVGVQPAGPRGYA